MIDATQILLIIVITILTVMLTVIGIQVVTILRDLRKTVEKLNRILSNTEIISEGLAQPVSRISELLLGLRTGLKIFGLFGRKDKEKEEKNE